MSDLEALKASYTVTDAWRDLPLSGNPGKICRSPFPAEHRNGDVHPSFSVFQNGHRWKNHATGESGDVIDLVKKVLNVDTSTAVVWIEKRVGVTRLDRAKRKAAGAPPSAGHRDLRTLSQLRSIGEDALRLADERGFLDFGTLFGHRYWAIRDGRRKLTEYRRLDGQDWPAYRSIPARKSHCRGRGKDWPIGIREAESFERIAWVEGAPDFLAVFQFLLAEGKEDAVAPVAMLGAANHRINPKALRLFQGKTVCLYPHLDPAGQRSAVAWAQQLDGAGARVEAFDLSRCIKMDGTLGKDLNDVTSIDPDCFETERKFWEVLP